jgi:cytidyltransferase-like protein
MKDTVLVMGTFDLPHPGHVELLRGAAGLGRVVVALNTSEFCHEYKGRWPVMTLVERTEVIGAIRYVDEVIVNEGGADAKVAIERVRPRYLVHGDDWTGESYMRQLNVDQDYLDSRGITLVYLLYTSGVSTSDLIERCKAM